MNAQNTTSIEDITRVHSGDYVICNDLPSVYDYELDTYVLRYDVIVWRSEEDSINDDGSRAVARYVADEGIEDGII